MKIRDVYDNKALLEAINLAWGELPVGYCQLFFLQKGQLKAWKTPCLIKGMGHNLITEANFYSWASDNNVMFVVQKIVDKKDLIGLNGNLGLHFYQTRDGTFVVSKLNDST